jgi:hypothetical protein
MKKLLSLLAVSVAVVLIVLPLAYGQGQGRDQTQAEKTFEGQLTKVDATAQTISVKGSAGEMLFRYTDQTQIRGPEKDVQGLAGKTGASLKITYRDVGENHIATAIEVVDKR